MSEPSGARTSHEVVLGIPFAVAALVGFLALAGGVYDVAIGHSRSGVRELVAACVLALCAIYFFRKIKR
jgi:hypothetical protein